MRRNNLLILLTGAFFAGIVFTLTIGAGPKSAPAKDPHLNSLLNLTSEQIAAIDQADPDFDADAADLSNALDDAKTRLAEVLESDDATDEQIRKQFESTIEAHNALKRRVAEHILKIRTHLEPEQRSRLMGLCAESVRSSRRHQNRMGQQGEGAGRGGGNGMGGGPGRGNGRGPGGGENGRGQYRGGQGSEQNQ